MGGCPIGVQNPAHQLGTACDPGHISSYFPLLYHVPGPGHVKTELNNHYAKDMTYPECSKSHVVVSLQQLLLLGSKVCLLFNKPGQRIASLCQHTIKSSSKRGCPCGLGSCEGEQCGLPQLRAEEWFLLWIVILSNINVS